ncbi:glutaredoxin family protein [Ferrigenium sp. UT4]
MPATVKLLLYGTTCCHLCAQAEAVLQAVGWVAEPVDIAQDDALLQRYGARIPVVRRLDNDTEIGWPFDESALREFIG